MNTKALELSPPPNGSEPQGFLAMIERVAQSPDIPVDKLERLLEMQVKVRAIEAQAAYASALARLQPKLPNIQERGEVQGRYKYALWEDIVAIITPILASEGFSLSFRTAVTDGVVIVTGVLLHALGHSESTSLPLPFDKSGNKPDVQAIGSSTSYGKRYTAGALLNLRTGEIDNDGGGTTLKVNEKQAADITALLDELGTKVDRAKFLAWLKADSIETILARDYKRAIEKLGAKR